MTEEATPVAAEETAIPAAATPETPVETAATETPPAVETPPAAETPPEAPKPIVTPQETSLLDGVASPEIDPDAPKWFLATGVQGEGEKPDWYKDEKYGSITDQAKAYDDLEGRFGAFTGAPKDGTYETKVPDGLVGEFDVEHPLFNEFALWANKSQLSQEAYDDVLGMFGRYEASLTPNMETIKAELGEDADSRIVAVNRWGKANLDTAQYERLRAATAKENAADVFAVLEAVIGKTQQPSMPKLGDDVVAAQPGGLAAIDAMQAKLGTNGKRLYETDAKYRNEVEQKRMDYFKQTEAAA